VVVNERNGDEGGDEGGDDLASSTMQERSWLLTTFLFLLVACTKLWWVKKNYDIESFDFSAKGFQNIQRMMAKFHQHSTNDDLIMYHFSKFSTK
jgi:hypothetical protein